LAVRVLDVIGDERAVHRLRGPCGPPAHDSDRAPQAAENLPDGPRLPDGGVLGPPPIRRDLVPRFRVDALHPHEEVLDAVFLGDLAGRDAGPDDRAARQRQEGAELSGRALGAHAREVGTAALIHERTQDVPFAGVHADDQHLGAPLPGGAGAGRDRAENEEQRRGEGDPRRHWMYPRERSLSRSSWSTGERTGSSSPSPGARAVSYVWSRVSRSIRFTRAA